MDLAHLYTEKQLEKIKRRFARTYDQAEKEVTRKLKEYLDGFAERDARMLEKVKSGQITDAQYAQWRYGQIAVGDRWAALQLELAIAYTEANTESADDVGAMLDEMFAESVNATMFAVEDFTGVDTSFVLWDENTVGRLIEEQPNLLPKPAVNIPKDIAWNQKKITAAVTQGILQGESMPRIAKRLQGVTDMNRKAALRNARTAVTGAENAGRAQGYREALDNGVNLKQQWLATLDNRTRHEHRQLDGQIQDVGKPFEVDGYELDYPGDPKAPPQLVYNCRCTTIAVVNGHAIDLDVRDKSVIGNYEEWKDGKKKQETQPQEETPKQNSGELTEITKLKESMGNDDDYNAFHDIVKNNGYVRDLYEDFANDVTAFTKNGGSYQPWSHSIKYRFDERKGKYATLSHEFGHALEDLGSGTFVATYGEVDAIAKASPYLGNFFKRLPSASDEYLAEMAKDKEIISALINSADVVDVRKNNKSHGIQDFADGLFGTQKSCIFSWGHGEKYYNRKYGDVKAMALEKSLQKVYKELGYDASNQTKVKKLTRRFETASELWANQMEALTVGGEALEYMEKYAPNTLAMLKKMLKERKRKNG